jgi:hypothetical protein
MLAAEQKQAALCCRIRLRAAVWMSVPRWRRTGSLASVGETFADALRIEAASSVASSRGHHVHAEL